MKTRKRMSEDEVASAKELCRKRDGAGCWYCKQDPQTYTKEKQKRKLIVHHVDNNPENNPKTGQNWKLACRPHNGMHSRGLSKFHPARNLRVEDLRVTRPQSVEMKRNIAARSLFEEYFQTCIDENGEVEVDDIIGYVCRETPDGGVVQSTVQRYLDIKTLGKNAPYFIDGDVIKAVPIRSEPESLPE